ncbi:MULTISPECIES: sensor histidine kinase [unclassified Sphingobium]|uniref:sensor histidine kinase n=2 Tax=Sphingobium TaxID=165695 RepID=UPI0015E76CEB|nr:MULTISPECIES: histidine kinase [unclassified Sphingobium]MBG6116531.1 signal transduction histidine kinase [Sphingobium sp. JAI105]
MHDRVAAATKLPSMAMPDAEFAPPWRGTRRTMILSMIVTILIWTVVGLFQAVPEVFNGFEWRLFVSHMIDAWTWALLTPAVLLTDRKLKSSQQNAAKLFLIYLSLSIPFTLIHTYLTGLFLYPIPDIHWNPLREAQFGIYFFLGGWMTYCAFVGILQAFNYYKRFLTSQLKLERAEKRFVEARLNMLRLQLEPHFLFNALNAISSQVVVNLELGQEMIEDLGALLRGSIDCQSSAEITLAQELAMLDHYLAIQKLRFGDRIDIRIDADPATLSAMVPSLLLQPLVENAIRHGIERRVSGGTIAISARLADDRLQIDVQDDGVGLPPDWRIETSSGLGLRVTRERLEMLYSEAGEHHFNVSPRQGAGTHVAIQIPLHTIGGEIDESAT